MTTIIINLSALILLGLSWRRSKERTKKALKLALKKGRGILPMLLIILVAIGLLLSFVPPEFLSQYLGKDSGIIQTLVVALIGALTFIPSIVALPLAGSLVHVGVGYIPIAAFITTLTMVGFVTLPLELKTLGKKVTLIRNLTSFIFALLISVVIGGLM